MWQEATTLAAVAVVIGVPLGILAGRLTWGLITTSMPLDYVPPLAVLATALVVPATALAVQVMVVWLAVGAVPSAGTAARRRQRMVLMRLARW
jgi:hypothetical protein